MALQIPPSLNRKLQNLCRFHGSASNNSSKQSATEGMELISRVTTHLKIDIVWVAQSYMSSLQPTKICRFFSENA